MPALVIAATAADTVINPKPGFARVSIYNPEDSAVRVTYHQGAEGPANVQPDPDDGASSLGIDETIVLNCSLFPIYLNTPGNVGGEVNYSRLE